MDSSERFSRRSLIIILVLVIIVASLTILIPFYNTEIITFLQGASPALDTFFIAVSYLGEPIIAIVIIVLLYWVHNKQVAKNLTVILLSSVYLNNVLKDTFQDPRPTGNQIVTESSYGFPSGHSQNAVATWGFLGHNYRKARWFSILSLVLIGLIAISRLYLGVHDLQDVLGGLLIGSLLVCLFLLLEPVISPLSNKLKFQFKLVIAVLLPILLFLIVMLLFPNSEGDYGLVCGALLGVSVGYLIETRYITIEYSQKKKILVIRALLGLIIVFGLYIVFDLFDLETQLYYFFSYMMIALAATILVPYLFQKLFPSQKA